MTEARSSLTARVGPGLVHLQFVRAAHVPSRPCGGGWSLDLVGPAQVGHPARPAHARHEARPACPQVACNRITMWVPAARAALRSARTFAEPSINIARSYKTVSTPNAPSAIGPYSQAVIHNGTVYVSGCIPFDPQTMQCVEGGIEAQAQRALDNLFAVVKASGSEPSKVLKTTVFLKDMNDFTKVNVCILSCTHIAGHLRKGVCAVQAGPLSCRGRSPSARRARGSRVHCCDLRVTRW